MATTTTTLYRSPMAYSIPVTATTLTQYDVEVSLASGEEVTYSVFQDPDGGDSPSTTARNWATEDGDTVEDTSVTKVSFNQNLLPDEMVTELLQRLYGSGVSFSDNTITFDKVDYDFLPEAVQSLEGDVEAGFYESVQEGIEDILGT